MKHYKTRKWLSFVGQYTWVQQGESVTAFSDVVYTKGNVIPWKPSVWVVGGSGAPVFNRYLYRTMFIQRKFVPVITPPEGAPESSRTFTYVYDHDEERWFRLEGEDDYRWSAKNGQHVEYQLLGAGGEEEYDWGIGFTPYDFNLSDEFTKVVYELEQFRQLTNNED